MAEDASGTLSPNAPYYDEFFDFEGMGFDELSNFIFPNYLHPSEGRFPYLSNVEEAIGHALSEDERELLCDLRGNRHEYAKLEHASFLAKLRAAVRRELYSALDEDLRPELDVQIGGNLDFSVLASKLFDDSRRTYFFGQEEASYGIGPSIFDKLEDPRNGDAGILYNPEILFELYEENKCSPSLVQRYNKNLGEHIYRHDDMDYKFFSWMQGYASFSPLMGFTSNYDIALAKALRPRNPNTFMYKDSAIYFFSVPNEFVIRDMGEASQILRGMKYMVYLKDKIVPGSAISIKDWKIRYKAPSFGTYRDILNLLAPKVMVVDAPCDDRARRSRIKHVFFYDCVAVRGKIFGAIGNGATLSRQIIGCGEKKALREWMDANRPMARNAYLDNPSLEFGLQ